MNENVNENEAGEPCWFSSPNAALPECSTEVTTEYLPGTHTSTSTSTVDGELALTGSSVTVVAVSGGLVLVYGVLMLLVARFLRWRFGR